MLANLKTGEHAIHTLTQQRLTEHWATSCYITTAPMALLCINGKKKGYAMLTILHDFTYI